MMEVKLSHGTVIEADLLFVSLENARKILERQAKLYNDTISEAYMDLADAVSNYNKVAGEVDDFIQRVIEKEFIEYEDDMEAIAPVADMQLAYGRLQSFCQDEPEEPDYFQTECPTPEEFGGLPRSSNECEKNRNRVT